jgi:PIN domain nuclease of toxin-antitoxin system
MATRRSMIFLDTHILCWLYDGLVDRLSKQAHQHINQASQLLISPIVLLELEYLYEIRRLKVDADKILSTLHQDLGVSVSPTSFSLVIKESRKINWTRDVFDRLIVATTSCHPKAKLVSKDQVIRDHFHNTVW